MHRGVLDVVTELTRDGKGVTAEQVARAMGRDRANVSRELNRLAREGFLEKVPGRPVLFLPKAISGRSASCEEKTAPDTKDPSCVPAGARTRRMPADFALEGTALGELVGAGGTLREACERGIAAVLYPPSGLHTLIIGPTGCGKSTFARAMHSFAVETGAWPANAPFVSVNCSEYSHNPNLLLSQLFGHTKGAFTGAYSDKVGLVERASSGMLFLDEVHRLPPQGQEMLFQIIDRGTYRRLGETGRERRVSLMLVAATTEDPSSCLLQTFLRRIPVVIQLPPLSRWKASERLALIEKFLQEEAAKLGIPVRLSPEALSYFMRSSFPGNVGELKSRVQLSCFRAFLSRAERDGEGEIVVSGDDVLQGATVFAPWNPGAARGAVLREGTPFRPGNPAFSVPEAGEERQSGEEMAGLCDPEVRKVLEDALPGISSRYSIPLGPRALYALSVHVTHRMRTRVSSKSRDERSPAGRAGLGYGTDVPDVDDKYRAAAGLLAGILQERLGIEALPEDLAVISGVLRAEVSGPAGASAGIVLALHGEGIATKTAAVVGEILGEDLVVPVDLDLWWSADRKTRAIASAVKAMGRTRGVCVLTDVSFPGYLVHRISEEAGVEVRLLGGASLPLILDIAARSLIPGISLEELVSPEVSPGDVFRLARTQARRAILVVAPSRTGAERIRDLLLYVFSEARDRGLTVWTWTRPGEDMPGDGNGERSYLVAVGTAARVECAGLPFVSFRDLLSGAGLDVLAGILRNAGYPVPGGEEMRLRLLRKITEDLLREQLTFLKPERLSRSCLEALARTEDSMGVCYPVPSCVRFVVHLACLVERLILGQPVLEHPQASDLFSTYPELAQALSATLRRIEDEFSCCIPDGEKAFLLEALVETGLVQ